MSEGAQRLTEAQRREFLNRFIGQPDSKTKGESKRYGKTLRKAVPRDVLGAWQPLVGRASATDLLLSQDEARVKELVPLRHVRMSADPFAFFRGAALVMASDLSTLPTTGIEVMAAGDAHIANFGLFLSPERRTVFDLNDFDECSRGPWEWDVARLVASIEILGRTRGFSVKRRDEAVLAAARGYRERLRMFAKVGNLDVWYTHIDVDDIEEALSVKVSKKEAKEIKKAHSRSKSKNNTRSTERLTECKKSSSCRVPIRTTRWSCRSRRQMSRSSSVSAARPLRRTTVSASWKASMPYRPHLTSSWDGPDWSTPVARPATTMSASCGMARRT